MSDLLWVKMPSWWIRNGLMKSRFSSGQHSVETASLKIYICLCLSSSTERTTIYIAGVESSLDRFESRLTYDQLVESASLSRALVARGIKKLVRENLIKVEGTTRKKVYVINGTCRSGWCKLPKRPLIKKGLQVSAFTGFTHRYDHERNGLKIFLYLISIRANSKRYIDVSRGAITDGTGVGISDVDGALGFLSSIGLLEKSSSKGYLKSRDAQSWDEREKLHRYYVVGSQMLNMRSYLVESDYDQPSALF